eukprot:gene3221-2203_t
MLAEGDCLTSMFTTRCWVATGGDWQVLRCGGGGGFDCLEGLMMLELLFVEIGYCGDLVKRCDLLMLVSGLMGLMLRRLVGFIYRVFWLGLFTPCLLLRLNVRFSVLVFLCVLLCLLVFAGFDMITLCGAIVTGLASGVERARWMGLCVLSGFPCLLEFCDFCELYQVCELLRVPGKFCDVIVIVVVACGVMVCVGGCIAYLHYGLRFGFRSGFLYGGYSSLILCVGYVMRVTCFNSGLLNWDVAVEACHRMVVWYNRMTFRRGAIVWGVDLQIPVYGPRLLLVVLRVDEMLVSHYCVRIKVVLDHRSYVLVYFARFVGMVLRSSFAHSYFFDVAESGGMAGGYCIVLLGLLFLHVGSGRVFGKLQVWVMLGMLGLLRQVGLFVVYHWVCGLRVFDVLFWCANVGHLVYDMVVETARFTSFGLKLVWFISGLHDFGWFGVLCALWCMWFWALILCVQVLWLVILLGYVAGLVGLVAAGGFVDFALVMLVWVVVLLCGFDATENGATGFGGVHIGGFGWVLIFTCFESVTLLPFCFVDAFVGCCGRLLRWCLPSVVAGRCVFSFYRDLVVLIRVLTLILRDTGRLCVLKAYGLLGPLGVCWFAFYLRSLPAQNRVLVFILVDFGLWIYAGCLFADRLDCIIRAVRLWIPSVELVHTRLLGSLVVWVDVYLAMNLNRGLALVLCFGGIVVYVPVGSVCGVCGITSGFAFYGMEYIGRGVLPKSGCVSGGFGELHEFVIYLLCVLSGFIHCTEIAADECFAVGLTSCLQCLRLDQSGMAVMPNYSPNEAGMAGWRDMGNKYCVVSWDMLIMIDNGRCTTNCNLLYAVCEQFVRSVGFGIAELL